ncbi:MAG: hypothetical protein HN893_01920, partial [Rhodospirillales bacterium]|nr:hypothetical protein [Rhodospirillales bacterium]
MSKKKPASRRKNRDAAQSSNPDTFMTDMISRMEDCPTAESLNDEIILPFALALEKVCSARGYLMNIYGEKSNVVVSTEEDAETIY